MSESLFEIFKRSPMEALEYMAKDRNKRLPFTYPTPDTVFVWQEACGKNSTMWYGSFRHLRLSELEGRKYEIKFYDDKPAIRWLDVVHNPKTHKNEPIENSVSE